MKFWTRSDTVFVVVIIVILFGGFALANYWNAEDAKYRTQLYQAWQKCEQSPLTEQEFWMLKRAGMIGPVGNKHECAERDCAAVERH